MNVVTIFIVFYDICGICRDAACNVSPKKHYKNKVNRMKWTIVWMQDLTKPLNTLPIGRLNSVRVPDTCFKELTIVTL